MLRWLTAGESHGQALVGIIEGMPAGVEVASADVAAALARRRLGYGRGARMKFEADAVRMLTGVRHGRTQGGPVAIEIGNSEWPKWEAVMSADPVAPELLQVDAGVGDTREIARNRPLTRPRPGHADLVGMAKYGFDEARPVLERASARETATRVALATVAAALLDQAAGIRLVSHVVSVGPVAVPDGAPLPGPDDVAALDANPIRCHHEATAAEMIDEIDDAKKDGDTLGGVVEVLAYGMPPGLGSYVHSDRRLDARLAGALMGIQAIKGVAVGDGFLTATRRGSVAHDEIARGEDGAIHRLTNRAGGVEGGMSNGEVLRVRAALKPISTVPRALATIDVATGEAATAIHQRSDVCAAAPAAVVAEAMVALVLAEALLEKTGGDSLTEVARNLAAYTDAIPAAMR
ncbi:chorismate synthase [Pseudactinotalea sp. HY160]|uniref:chorismate synthase n=1 Tax=Pseudactinotalea sp. HY160 TaxID=2654490 RepID=UPI00128C4FB7|nr:chorismate synthase [Pseudactinotalea sp. HY160]MPV49346.1 chorismate synthase [Pseudactinotalea sp. HY160]